MVICAPQPRREPASCCIVDVVKGAFGRSVRGDSSVLITVSCSPVSCSVRSRANFSSRRRISSLFDLTLNWPLSSKSLVVATFLPSSEISRAVKFLSVAAFTSHHEEEMNAIRSRSRSTINRVATDCTRPAEIRGMTFFQSTGERR